MTDNGTLSNNAIDIFKKRYAIDENEDWASLCNRVARINTQYEKDKSYTDKFSEMHYNCEFLGAGRILRNSGRSKGSLLNCYVIPIDDSIEEIGDWIKSCLITWSSGGGIGSNISTLRPTGSLIKSKGGFSSGPISFLKANNQCGNCIESGGQRRAAGMALMEVRHPNIVDFINAKIIDGEFNCFNISVGINDEFLDCVEKNAVWDLKFNQQIYKSVPAIDIWQLIIQNMIKFAEPGLLNMTNLCSNNSYFFQPIICSNPCGEAPLSANGVCDLGSIVLSKFVSNKNTNWKRMEEVIRLGVRFLDNVLDINPYVLKQYQETAQAGRRIGIGVIGLADYFFMKKIRYGSPKSIQEAEKLTKFIRDISYDESIKLSIEKGSFPKFNSYDYSKAHFVRTLPAPIRKDIKKYGIRNVTLMAMAPTGTISMIPEATSGIEPLVLKGYERKDRVSNRIYIHPLYEKILNEEGTTPDWFVDTNDLKPEDHLNMQVAIQRFTDGAVSKTINLPKGTTPDQLSDLLLEYIRDLKGVTVYVDGSKEGQPLNHITEKQALEHIKKKNVDNNIDECMMKCSSGKCDL